MTGTDRMPTWVVGAGGLLGRALVASLRRRRQVAVTAAIPWADVPRSREMLSATLRAYLATTLDHGLKWRIAWCAGAGVTGSSASDLENERTTFSSFLDELATLSPAGSGTLFFASSAGGVFAGASNPPFTEFHSPEALAPYGVAKLSAEASTHRFALESQNSVLIGRIANLYGPGQNLGKSQGLISHLCRAHLTGQPLSVFVSLDTIRDYLYVDDCADMISDALASDRFDPGQVVIKILASNQGTTVGALIGECRRVFKRTPRIVLGSSPTARFQVKDLRLRSAVWPELDRRSLTTLPAGIAATVASLQRSYQLARP